MDLEQQIPQEDSRMDVRRAWSGGGNDTQWAFHDEQDADFLRMIAILEAEETMQRGVSDRDNPSTFLA
jgi:hypothetical protein